VRESAQRLLIVAVAKFATSRFMGWLSDWHIRAQLAYAAEKVEQERMKFADVLPWSVTRPPIPAIRCSSFFPEDAIAFPRITESGLPDQFGKEPSNVRAFKPPGT
jgi:hypothetical protein